ncbi:MAG: DUF5714 domain-containing protein [Methanocorpusculum sp.]|nr:DUF5714 domain-containing protein [Methanocorpusculum sp.]
MSANVSTKCMICGEEITQGDVPIKSICDICGEEFTSYNFCENGHHVCMKCVTKLFADAKDIFLNTKSENPIKIAEEVMDLPNFTLLGCKHYFVASLALCAAFKNSGGVIEDYEKVVSIIIERISQLPPSMCKVGSICGVPLAVGAGLHATGLKSQNDDIHNKMSSKLTAFCIEKMFHEEYTGNSECCKRNTYICIHAGAIFIKNNFWVEMSLPKKIVCKYSEGNPKCNKDKCRLYRGKSSDNI